MSIYHNRSGLSRRFRLILTSFLQGEGLPFADVLPEKRIEEAFADQDAEFAEEEECIYTPAITLWAFLSQVLFKDEQRSCLAAVSRVLVLLVALGREPCGGVPGRSGRGVPGTRTDYGCLSNFVGRPGLLGRSTRPTVRSRRSTKAASPSGCPVWPCSRMSRSSSSRIALFRKPRQSAIIASMGATRTSRSSRPDKCDLALLQRHWTASSTRPARTGFNSTYRAAASKYGSSMTNDANRPCHKYPRHFSRKLIRRV